MMTPRFNLIGVFAISLLCISLICASQRYASNSYYATEYYKPGDKQAYRLSKSSKHLATHNSNKNRDSENLAALTSETNGIPFRSVIITTWRSGSTFLGDILNAMPGNYYHYEPLLDFDIIQIRGAPYAKRAIYNLKQLLKCNYTDMKDYLDFGAEHDYLFTHNTRLWKYCRLYPHHCWDPNFLTPFCKLFPLQSMKVVRLRLALAEQLLNDPHLNVRIVLLIRDPRGTMQSRKHRDWCPGNSDCDQAHILCKDMVSDYYAAEILSKRYPQNFKAVRYEDLSLDPFKMTEEILNFYGLPLDPIVEEFLDTHTRNNIGGVSSTFRDSKSAPFHWMRDLTYEEIETIQNSCTTINYSIQFYRFRFREALLMCTADSW